MATKEVKAHLNTCDYGDCRHEWLSRSIPDRCSKCKRRRWNRGGSIEEIDAALALRRANRRPGVAKTA